MENKNLKYFIGLAILVIAIAVVWVAWPKQKNEQQDGQNQAKDIIPELNKILPSKGLIEKYDKDSREVTFAFEGRTYVGKITDQTRILKQVKDKKGVISIDTGKVSDIAKGKIALIYPAPAEEGAFEITSMQLTD